MIVFDITERLRPHEIMEKACLCTSMVSQFLINKLERKKKNKCKQPQVLIAQRIEL